jgi:hypothetical protein
LTDDPDAERLDAKPTGAKPLADRPRRRPLIRGMARGGIVGAGTAVLLLILFCILVFLRATISSVNVADAETPVSIVPRFLLSMVCLGPLFLAFCTFLGGAVGLVRSRL